MLPLLSGAGASSKNASCTTSNDLPYPVRNGVRFVVDDLAGAGFLGFGLSGEEAEASARTGLSACSESGGAPTMSVMRDYYRGRRLALLGVPRRALRSKACGGSCQAA